MQNQAKRFPIDCFLGVLLPLLLEGGDCHSYSLYYYTSSNCDVITTIGKNWNFFNWTFEWKMIEVNNEEKWIWAGIFIPNGVVKCVRLQNWVSLNFIHIIAFTKRNHHQIKTMVAAVQAKNLPVELATPSYSVNAIKPTTVVFIMDLAEIIAFSLFAHTHTNKHKNACTFNCRHTSE